MDNNAILRSSLLYFTDEAIGYRHSLHLFNRWLETGSKTELEALIIEVGREKFIDLTPIIDYANGNASEYAHKKLIDIVCIKGIYIPRLWTEVEDWDPEHPTKLSPLASNIFDSGNANSLIHNLETMSHWIADNPDNNPFDVLRQALTYLDESRKNFYQIFYLLEMLFGYDTIFSCVVDDDINLLGHIVGSYYPPAHAVGIKKLASAISKHPDLNWKDALSRNQVKSKVWLIDKLDSLKLLPKKRQLGDPECVTAIAGGWVGMLPFLATMMGKNLDSVINFDIDNSVHSAAMELNAGTHSNFKNSETDIKTVDFKKYKKLLMIDTIVEHFENHGEWVNSLPAGTTVVLQGNDMFDVPDHVNCHNTLEEFLETCGLNTIIWAGELNLFKCTRFMAIGKV